MTLRPIFNQYFKVKLLVWGGIGILTTSIRYFNGHPTSFLFSFSFILFALSAAFIIGLIDYNFYEKTAPKLVFALLDKTPLIDFQNNGFKKDEQTKLSGQINNFKVILAPLTNIQRDNFLTVLIPLQLREGLDEYFNGLDGNFKLRFNDNVLFAQTVLRDYEKKYDYAKLFDLINKTTLYLRDKNIEPIKLEDEKYSS